MKPTIFGNMNVFNQAWRRSFFLSSWILFIVLINMGTLAVAAQSSMTVVSFGGAYGGSLGEKFTEWLLK